MRYGRNKYGNNKAKIDGHIFDSVLESERYLFLKSKLNEGAITELYIQPEFDLLKEFYYFGLNHSRIKIRPTIYIADFKYNIKDSLFVEDVKGFKTPEYLLKKKMFLYKYNQKLYFFEITRKNVGVMHNDK